MVSVYVGNLSYETSWQTLKDHMKEAGEVVRANVKTRQDGRSAGFGIVEFADEAGAANAIETLMDTELDGRKIVVREDNGGKQREGGGEGGGRGGPVRSQNGGSGTTVFVGNLSYDTTWQSLKDHMKEAGEVRRPLPLHHLHRHLHHLLLNSTLLHPARSCAPTSRRGRTASPRASASSSTRRPRTPKTRSRR